MPDEVEMGGYTHRESTLSKAILAAVGVAFVCIMGLGFAAATRAEKSSRVFMASCIEFHSVARCRDLDSYGRRDLGK